MIKLSIYNSSLQTFKSNFDELKALWLLDFKKASALKNFFQEVNPILILFFLILPLKYLVTYQILLQPK